ADDGADSWRYRSDLLVRVVREIDPDILATQEGLSFQLEELDAALPQMGRFGLGRYHGVAVDRPHEAYSGEHCAIYYRRPRFELVSADTMWLSDTPEVPGSLGWGAGLARIVTHGRVRDAHTRREWSLINTHFHWGEEVTRKSTDILCELLADVPAATAVILTGDFNLPPSSPEHERLTTVALAGGRRLVDACSAADGCDEDVGTFHAFVGSPEQRIDWILVSSDAKVTGARVVRDEEDGRYPSDHFPVVADVHPGASRCGD
ncbi:MAG: endonuclease/exonuclease/phosphatase family protein, partial [Spirochaetota bacterium]